MWALCVCAHVCTLACCSSHVCFSLEGWRVMAHCWKHFSVFITRQQGTKPTVSFEDYQALWWDSRHCKAAWNWAFLCHGVIGAPAVLPAPQQLSNEVTGEALGPCSNPTKVSGQTSVDSSGRWGHGLCVGERALWDAAGPRGVFMKFLKSSRSSVAPDCQKGMIWVKEIIKTSEGPVCCCFWYVQES